MFYHDNNIDSSFIFFCKIHMLHSMSDRLFHSFKGIFSPQSKVGSQSEAFYHDSSSTELITWGSGRVATDIGTWSRHQSLINSLNRLLVTFESDMETEISGDKNHSNKTANSSHFCVPAYIWWEYWTEDILAQLYHLGLSNSTSFWWHLPAFQSWHKIVRKRRKNRSILWCNTFTGICSANVNVHPYITPPFLCLSCWLCFFLGPSLQPSLLIRILQAIKAHICELKVTWSSCSTWTLCIPPTYEYLGLLIPHHFCSFPNFSINVCFSLHGLISSPQTLVHFFLNTRLTSDSVFLQEYLRYSSLPGARGLRVLGTIHISIFQTEK